MRDYVLVGRQGRILEVPAEKWLEHLEGARHHPSQRLAFMTPEHHLVRNFAVVQLPRNKGKPMRAQEIGKALQLPLDVVETLLDDLEKQLFFLVRNPAGEVTWAYPVTVEKTPHRLRFSTGEETFAA